MAFDLFSGIIGKFSLMTFCYQVGASGGMLSWTQTTVTVGGRVNALFRSHTVKILIIIAYCEHKVSYIFIYV